MKKARCTRLIGPSWPIPRFAKPVCRRWLAVGSVTGLVLLSACSGSVTVDPPASGDVVGSGTVPFTVDASDAAESVGAATVTITDDDPPAAISFSRAAQSVAETERTISISVQLSAPSRRKVTVPYTVSGTATGGGVDFETPSGFLEIPAGVTTGRIVLNLAADSLAEPEETVALVLGTPTNATLAAPTTHTVTIVSHFLVLLGGNVFNGGAGAECERVLELAEVDLRARSKATVIATVSTGSCKNQPFLFGMAEGATGVVYHKWVQDTGQDFVYFRNLGDLTIPESTIFSTAPHDDYNVLWPRAVRMSTGEIVVAFIQIKASVDGACCCHKH